jgi:hypothetical protein
MAKWRLERISQSRCHPCSELDPLPIVPF